MKQTQILLYSGALLLVVSVMLLVIDVTVGLIAVAVAILYIAFVLASSFKQFTRETKSTQKTPRKNTWRQAIAEFFIWLPF